MLPPFVTMTGTKEERLRLLSLLYAEASGRVDNTHQRHSKEEQGPRVTRLFGDLLF
jgi:hypothetical protein